MVTKCREKITYAVTSTDRPAAIVGKFRGGAWGRSPKVRDGDVGVNIPPIFHKYYSKLTVFSYAYRRRVTMVMYLSIVCL